MPVRVWKSLCIRAFGLMAVLFSLPSFAFSQKVLEQILEQDPDTQKLALLVVVGILAFLCLYILIVKIQLGGSRKKVKQHNQVLADKQALLNDFKVGMLHVNAAGEIVFANQTAAFFLGSKEDKLLGQTLTQVFDDNIQQQIKTALDSAQYVPLQTYLNVSKRHLQLGFSKQLTNTHGITCVVSVADVTNYQHKTDQQAAQINHLTLGMKQLNIARLSIDLEKKTVISDQIFADLLAMQEPIEIELAQFKNMLNPNILFDWEKALEASKKQHHMTFEGEFILHTGSTSENQSSAPTENQDQEYIALRLNGQSSQKNANGDTTALEFFVQDLSAIEQQKVLLHTSQQQAKTLLATSPNPVYVLDEQGNFVDCNAAFESMFKQKLNKIQHKKLQELDILPEAFNSLHTENSANFGSMNLGHEKEFEITLADEVLHTLTLKLKFFAGKNKKRAGVVGVIQDITELKQTKEQLEQERKHFTSILDLAPVAVTIIDADDRIVSANIAMTDRLGLSERELKKDTFYQLFNDPSNAGKAAKEIQQSGRLRGFVAHLKGKNEQLHPSELHVDLLNKQKQHYLCWISDRSKEQFHQDKFDGLLEHSSMPMAVLAEQGFTKLNPAACEFFNLTDQHELFGRTPFAAELNLDEQASHELERHINKVKLDGQAKSLKWEHSIDGQTLPCQATFVPMYKGQEFDSILCIWTDFRDLQQADEARLEAINLHQAAEKEVAAKQQQLQSSQDILATKMRNLADTESKLQAAQEDLTEKQSEFSSLQEAHQSVTDNLQQLQQDYNHNRTQLSQAQEANSELATQLEESTAKVTGLQAQRNQISDALQHSEKKYQSAQQELAQSEKNAENLKQSQLEQQQKVNEFVAEIDSLKQSMQQKDQQINEVGSQINSLQSQLASSGNTSDKLRQLLVNQRKASEQAEEQRRTLEQTYKVAQSELSNKVRHVEHLQNEMQKFEEMSNQQKGDMQQQQSQLMQELEAKQQQLQATQQALDETKQVAEQDKVAREQQQQEFERLQQELAEMELRSQQQQQKMTETEQEWHAQQQQIQQALADKQQQLQATERTLQQAKEQSEAEKAEKEQQLAVFEKLQAELAEVEQRNNQQQQQIAERDNNFQQQQLEMQQALQAKQQQLHETEQNLNQEKEQTQAEKKQQQALFKKLQSELSEMQARNEDQQQQMAKSDQEWQQQQQKVQQELANKQQQLQETEQLLSKTKQQTEAEKAEKEQQQALFEKLQVELAEMEQRSAQQQQKIAQSDQDWQKQQQALQDEVEAKRQQLNNTQDNLNDIKRQADAEKLARIEQQQKLEQLTVELTDVESRAVKQKEMIEGSDEQWRKHHDEIEQQKLQLQQALIDAEQQNNQLQQKLQGNLEQLQDAESQVTETKTGEQKLQQELDQARTDAQQLQQRLAQQEEQERKLQQQLEQQQHSLQGSEQNIQSLEAKQAELTKELQQVQQQYSNSKASLNDQHSDHAQLAKQLQKLEQELHNSQSQLDNKEQALQEAKNELQSNQAKLAEQENALLSAHKEELQQAIEQQPVVAQKAPSAIVNIQMPDNPTVWFDLLPYLQNQNITKPLPIALNELMDELETGIKETDQAVGEDDVTSILRGARKLVVVANKVNSEALTDVVTRLEADCRQGLVDNIAISWPTVQRSLNSTLRVIYSHLNN